MGLYVHVVRILFYALVFTNLMCIFCFMHKLYPILSFLFGIFNKFSHWDLL